MISEHGALASPFTGVPGWLTNDEEGLLKAYAEAVPADGCIVNIGVEFGRSLATLTKFSSTIAEVVGVDKTMLVAASRNMDEAGLSGRYQLIEADSQTMKFDTLIDLIFIDGDHSVRGVERDIMKWTPRMKVGGIVVFHDCACITNRNPHPDHYDVTRAVNTWVNSSKGNLWWLDKMVDSMMAFRKVKDEPFESSTL